MWEDTQQQCRQVPSVGPKLGERLSEAGLGDLRAISAADPRQIERVTQKTFPVTAAYPLLSQKCAGSEGERHMVKGGEKRGAEGRGERKARGGGGGVRKEGED